MPRIFMVLVGLWCCTNFAHAKVFDMNLFVPTGGIASGNFFNDYTHFSTCEIEIDDSVFPVPPNTLIDIHTPAFKKIECNLKGSDSTYNFSSGSDIPLPDFWNGSYNPSLQFGLLFDGAGEPLRLDSPQIASESGGAVGWYDSAEAGYFGGCTDHSFFAPIVEDYYQTPDAILLEQTVIYGVPYPRGTRVKASDLPPGAKVALVNGTFYFSEQNCRDLSREPIPLPLLVGGYYTFDQKLTVPKLRITQAVFQDDDAEIRLVDKRTTAIIVDKGEFFGDRKIDLKIVKTSDGVTVFPDENEQIEFEAGEESGQVIFFCDETENYCSLEKGERYEISIEYGVNGTEVSKNVVVIETKMLDLFYVPVISADCNAPEECGFNQELLRDFAGLDNMLTQSLFPLRDGGLSFAPDLNNDAAGTSVKEDDFIRAEKVGFSFSKKFGFPGFTFTSADDAINADVEKLDKLRDKHSTSGTIFNRAVGYVYPDYFTEKGMSAGGLTLSKYKASLSKPGGAPIISVHEIGHTFGLPKLKNNLGKNEEYDVVDGHFSSVRSANGYDIYEYIPNPLRLRMNKFNFMADANAGVVGEYWVNERSWNILINELSKDNDEASLKAASDPALIQVSFIISNSDEITPLRWHYYDNRRMPDAGSGNGIVELISYGGEIIGTYRYEPSFTIPQEIGPDRQSSNSFLTV